MEVLWIALGAIGIALVVFILKRTVPGLKTPKEDVDEKKEAENNVNRMTIPFEEEKEKKDEKEEQKEEDESK